MSECWTYSAGTKPNTVTVYERKPGGLLYARAWDPHARAGKGNWKRVSLKHRDKKRAKRYATDEASKIQKGDGDIAERRFTLTQVFALYLQHRTPRKSRSEQLADNRRVEMWTRVLGNVDPHNISLAKWEAFIDSRRCGAIDARGEFVPSEGRKLIRSRAVEADCKWLRLVFNWATKWRLEDGCYLMRENPVRGFAAPVERNPVRPVATTDYFQRLRDAADNHTMELRAQRVVRVPSYLPELLDIASGTGRRISAICALRYCDLQLEKTELGPYGSIRWAGEHDKQGKQWTAPISPMVRDALSRVLKARPGVGNGYIFPAPGNQEKCISKRLASRWYREAEEAAGLAHVSGQGWHSLRRAWATSRKHMPDADVMAAGGWKSLVALKTCYQHADAETMLAVILGGGELKQA